MSPAAEMLALCSSDVVSIGAPRLRGSPQPVPRRSTIQRSVSLRAGVESIGRIDVKTNHFPSGEIAGA